MSDVILQGLVIKPGDVLLLSYQRVMSEREASEIKARVRAALPDLAEVQIVCGADHIGVARKTEDVE